MKTVISNAEELLDRAAAQVKALLTEKPDAVLALSAGEDCLRLLERLAKMQQAGELRFSRAKFFAVTELCGGEHSVKDRLTKAFSAARTPRRVTASSSRRIILNNTMRCFLPAAASTLQF